MSMNNEEPEGNLLKKELDNFMESIVQIVNEKIEPENNIKKERFRNIRGTYESAKNFKEMIDSLYSSELKEYISYSNEYFKEEKNYIKFCNHSGSIKDFKDKITNKNKVLSDYKSNTIYTAYKESDPYFREMKNLYDFIENSSLKKQIGLKIGSLKKYIKSNDKYPYLCPFCQSEEIEYKELDHFLPKSIFPILSLNLDNLIPICKMCNSPSVKGSKMPNFPILHPYDEKVMEIGTPIDCIDFKFIGFDEPCAISIKEGIDKNTISKPNQLAVENYLELFDIRKRYQSEAFKEVMIRLLGQLNEDTLTSLKSPTSSKNISLADVRNVYNYWKDKTISNIENNNRDSRSYLKYKTDILKTLSDSFIKQQTLFIFAQLELNNRVY